MNSPIETQAASVKGRSLWDDARTRLLANRAAMMSLFTLVIITLACFIGPYFSGHEFDTVYKNYVKVPAGLKAYPQDAQITPAIKKILKRAKVEVDSINLDADKVKIQIRSTNNGKALDKRILRYLDRSDLFSNSRIEIAQSGTNATIKTDVSRHRFLFGTDSTGRDLLTRTLIAGRVSLIIGLLATAVALLIGVTYGAAAGYIGGRTDAVMMRIVDILYSLPFIFFVILLVVFFGRNFVLMFIAVGAVEWLDMARIVRGQTLSLKRQEFVQAAQAMGASSLGILRRHIIPNTLGPVAIYMTLLVPKVILVESFLSFLGLGVQEPMSSWGVLISEGARNIQGATWMLIYPSLFLTTTLFCLNFIGDGLRDALDPKDR